MVPKPVFIEGEDRACSKARHMMDSSDPGGQNVIQLLRERLSGKKVHATIPKGNMGYDQYTVPGTVAVELTFVAFL